MNVQAVSRTGARLKRIIPMLLLLLMIGLNVQPGTSTAANGWDEALEGINAVYDETAALRASVETQTKTVTALRTANNAGLKDLREQVGRYDSARLTKLKAADAAVKSKHAKLVAEYASLGKQLKAAKEAKQEKQAAMLNLKRNKLKPAYTSARTEMQTAAGAYTSAKKQTAAKLAPVTEALAKVTQLKKRITEKNKEIAGVRKQRVDSDKQLKAAVKAGDAVAALKELRALRSHFTRLRDQQAVVLGWEKEIAALLQTAHAKFPAS